MIIRSERLMMCPVSEGDAESLLGVFRDPAVRRYLLDDSLVSLEWVRNEIASSDERFATVGAGLWAIRFVGFVETTAVIGFVGFRGFFDPPRLQLLYGLLPEYWGRGLATEAAKRVCDHAFS
ncbi:MAG: GNAT family N-acetyltransferase, partial [Acidobacteria bacterium]|nr:GNAT family N-acetyltransferase [Acidobacteriota bacterium]